MSIGTLWTIETQATGTLARATAILAGLEISLPEAYTHFEDNKKPEFLAKFPHGKIPAWEGKDGFKLFESIPIATYLASLAPNSGLLGGSAKDAALVDQWLHFSDTEIGTSQMTINYYLLKGVIPYSKPIHTFFTERLVRSLTTVDEHLKTRTFLVTERITVADLGLATLISRAVGSTIDAPLRAKIPNVIRHMETIVNNPKLKELYGPTKYIDKALQYVAPKKDATPKA